VTAGAPSCERSIGSCICWRLRPLSFRPSASFRFGRKKRFLDLEKLIALVLRRSDDAYRVTLPSGARYHLARSDVNGSNKRHAALALVRSQLTSEYSSYMHMWSRFWFLLAGACGVAMLLTLASRLIEDAESRLVGMAHP
jgi:hypothetical protein